MKKETKKNEAPREHKKPWQETYATPEEIKAMLDARVSLRYNEVRGRTEIHWLSAGPVIKPDEQGLLTIFGDDESVTDGYANLDDRDINTLWTVLCQEKPVIKPGETRHQATPAERHRVGLRAEVSPVP